MRITLAALAIFLSSDAFAVIIPCNVPPAQCQKLCGNSFYNGTYNVKANNCDAHIKDTPASSARVTGGSALVESFNANYVGN